MQTKKIPNIKQLQQQQQLQEPPPQQEPKKQMLDREIGFELFKSVTMEQNRALIKQIAKDHKRTESRWLYRYLKPEYYLPIVEE